jgi:hypothetical protein
MLKRADVLPLFSRQTASPSRPRLSRNFADPRAVSKALFHPLGTALLDHSPRPQAGLSLGPGRGALRSWRDSTGEDATAKACEMVEKMRAVPGEASADLGLRIGVAIGSDDPPRDARHEIGRRPRQRQTRLIKRGGVRQQLEARRFDRPSASSTFGSHLLRQAVFPCARSSQ